MLLSTETVLVPPLEEDFGDGIDSLEDDTIEKEDEEMEDETMEFSDILGCMLRLNTPFKNIESINKLASVATIKQCKESFERLKNDLRHSYSEVVQKRKG